MAFMVKPSSLGFIYVIYKRSTLVVEIIKFNVKFNLTTVKDILIISTEMRLAYYQA